MDYSVLKALHLISVISWMSGMFYLPRLFAYHVLAPVGSEQAETFKTMERRLLRIIINPAMILTFVFGVWMIVQSPELMKQGWLHAKFGLVFLMAGFHGMCARWRKQLARDEYRHSNKYFRLMNEVPTVLMIVIVLLAVTKPF